MDVLLRVRFCAEQKEVNQQFFAVGPKKAKYHCANRIICCELLPEVARDLLGLLRAHVPIQVKVGPRVSLLLKQVNFDLFLTSLIGIKHENSRVPFIH